MNADQNVIESTAWDFPPPVPRSRLEAVQNSLAGKPAGNNYTLDVAASLIPGMALRPFGLSPLRSAAGATSPFRRCSGAEGQPQGRVRLAAVGRWCLWELECGSWCPESLYDA